MPISEPLFWSLSLCFSPYVSCVCCPLCLSSHLFLCLHPCLCLCPFYLSVLSFPAPLPLSLWVCPHCSESPCLSLCVRLCVYISSPSCVSLFLLPDSDIPSLSLPLSLCVPVLVQTPAPGCHASLAWARGCPGFCCPLSAACLPFILLGRQWSVRASHACLPAASQEREVFRRLQAGIPPCNPRHRELPRASELTNSLGWGSKKAYPHM